jgi:hypothetical protein
LFSLDLRARDAICDVLREQFCNAAQAHIFSDHVCSIDVIVLPRVCAVLLTLRVSIRGCRRKRGYDHRLAE